MRPPAGLLAVMLFGIDAERAKNSRVHVVEPDQHAQFDDLPFVEVGPQRLEHIVGHSHIAGHGVGIG